MKLGKRNSRVTIGETQKSIFNFAFSNMLNSFVLCVLLRLLLPICLYLESFSDDILFIVEHSLQRIMANTNFHNWFRIANRHLNEYFKLDMSITYTQKNTNHFLFCRFGTAKNDLTSQIKRKTPFQHARSECAHTEKICTFQHKINVDTFYNFAYSFRSMYGTDFSNSLPITVSIRACGDKKKFF